MMSDDQVMADVNYEEQYRSISEENKKLSIDIASLQLSNRSLVNQNRDEKKKVMDCRLQISDLESRLKSLESIKNELAESQTQAERLRQSLDATESKLKTFEKRAIDAEGLIRVKDSIIDKQRKFSKVLEDQVKSLAEERESFILKCGNLEMNLNEALDRAEECERLREIVAAKTALLDQLADSSEGISASGLAAANAFFKQQEAKLSEQLSDMKACRAELEYNLKTLTSEKEDFEDRISKQDAELEELRVKCNQLETRVKECGISEKKSKHDMSNTRLIGPSLPPWIMEEKKTDPSDLEKLNKADPATLRARVLELEKQVHELNQLLTYREDVILRIYQETKRKANQVEAIEVDRSSLAAQVGILKRELACFRDDGPRRRGGYPPEIEIEIERLRGKRDREYQRRKRAEAEMDELDTENTELKGKLKKLEETVINLAPPKLITPLSDPSDKNRISELQATVNQLRMDNEAKRSELFDLRSRFDEKSAQLETFSSEMKTKERAVTDLSIELSSKIGQLEYANKELESVRCRVVRGGSETERWQTDLNSVRTTNRFLSSQTDELRIKLADTEEQLSRLQHQLISLKTGNNKDTGQPLLCSSCGRTICNGFNSNNGENSHATEEEQDSLERQCKHLEKRLTEAYEKEAQMNEQMDLFDGKLTQKDQLCKELESRLFEALHGKSSQADKEIEDLKYQLRVRCNEYKTLENKFIDIQRSFSEEIKSLNEVITLWTKKCSDLEENAIVHSEYYRKQEIELKDTKEAEIRDLKSKISALETDKDSGSLKETEIVNLKEKLSLFEIEIEKNRKDTVSFNELEAANHLEITNLKAQIVDIDAQLKEAHRYSTNTSKSEVAKELEIVSLQAQLSDVQSQLEEARIKIETFEASHADLNEITAKCANLEAALEHVKIQDNMKLQTLSDEAAQYATESQLRVQQLLNNLKEEQKASASCSNKCTQLTVQLSELESSLEATRAKLTESSAEHRKADIEHAEATALTVSPPAKRARRTRSGCTATTAPLASSGCSVCTELKKQVDELESDLNESNSKVSASMAELNQLREEVARASENACELRRQISTIQAELSASNENICTLKHAIKGFLHQLDNKICVLSGDLVVLNSLRLHAES